MTMSRCYMPTGAAQRDDMARLEDARELIEAVRSDLPRNSDAEGRADEVVHGISELMRGLRR